MKSSNAKVAIPINPQERPKIGSTLSSEFPSKSSHENVSFDEQKLPPSLIFDEIHKVCVDTAKPANEINWSPPNNYPRVVAKEGNLSFNELVRLLPQGVTIKNPINVGIKYIATIRLDDISSTFPRN